MSPLTQECQYLQLFYYKSLSMFGATIVLNIIVMLNLRSRSHKTKMFRKLVSNLPFSPALVGQLGFYAKRLRKEQITRKLGLFFTIFAVLMQSFAVFSPPEQVSASTGSSIIQGGITSVQDILTAYDAGAQGKSDYKDIF